MWLISLEIKSKRNKHNNYQYRKLGKESVLVRMHTDNTI